MKRITIAIVCSMFFVLNGKSQEKTDAMLFGDVKDAKTGEHIPYVHISIQGSNIGTLSDGTGHFKMANLPLGKNRLTFQVLGYKSVEQDVFMERDKTTQVYVELEEDALLLQQLVVTATRSEHFLKDVPVRTEVITSSAFKKKNALNVFQALEGIPGVRVENQCQYCNFTMIRIQGLGAEHTQVLIDGQSTYSGLAGVYGLQQIGTAGIDKIEIVKGAGSALYGSGAIAGAINIITKEPGYTPEISLDIQAGSYGTSNIDFSSSIRNEKGNIGLNIYAQNHKEDAIDQTGEGVTQKEVKNPDGISDRVRSNLTNVGFNLYVEDAFFKNDKLVLRGKTIFEQREGGIILDDYYRNPLTDRTENISTNRMETSLSYIKKISKNESLDFSLSYVNHERDATNDTYLTDYLSTHNDTAPDLRDMRPYLATNNTITYSLGYSKKAGNHNLITGIQGLHDHIEESGMYVVVDESSPYLGQSYRSVADKNAWEIGLYLQDEWKITDKLIVVPGVRIDYHNSGEKYHSDKQISSVNLFPQTTFRQTAVNPRIAVKYSLTDRIVFRTSAGTGFRAPYGFSEELHLCSGSPRVWKTSELESERSVSFNASADYYGEKIKYGANLFRTVLKNKIDLSNASSAAAALGYDYQWENIDDAIVQGVELSAAANVTKNFKVGVDFTYNHGEYKKNRLDWVGTDYEKISRKISRFPSTTGNFNVEYAPNRWSVMLIGGYQGVVYIDYYNTDIDPLKGDQSAIKKTNPYMLLNGRVAKDIGIFKIYTGANNILSYIQDEKHLDDAAFIYAPLYGATFYVGTSIRINH